MFTSGEKLRGEKEQHVDLDSFFIGKLGKYIGKLFFLNYVKKNILNCILKNWEISNILNVQKIYQKIPKKIIFSINYN